MDGSVLKEKIAIRNLNFYYGDYQSSSGAQGASMPSALRQTRPRPLSVRRAAEASRRLPSRSQPHVCIYIPVSVPARFRCCSKAKEHSRTRAGPELLRARIGMECSRSSNTLPDFDLHSRISPIWIGILAFTRKLPKSEIDGSPPFEHRP